MMEEEITQQAREEHATAACLQALKEKFAAAADAKINGPQDKDDRRVTVGSDAVVKDANVPPPEGTRRGSKIHKAAACDRLEQQLCKQERRADSARALAASLKMPPPPPKETTHKTPQTMDRVTSRLLTGEPTPPRTGLFQKSPLFFGLGYSLLRK